MTAQLCAYVDAICDGATEPLGAEERRATMASFTSEFPHLSALLSSAPTAA